MLKIEYNFANMSAALHKLMSFAGVGSRKNSVDNRLNITTCQQWPDSFFQVLGYFSFKFHFSWTERLAGIYQPLPHHLGQVNLYIVTIHGID